MIAEADKYVGYPYVWGGSSPSTSFDCSGFISWVINHSGWNVGRLTAQGLYNICTPVTAEQAKPGDLVFFVGTYDTPGVSHVGLYVGNSYPDARKERFSMATNKLDRIERDIQKTKTKIAELQKQLRELEAGKICRSSSLCAA